MVAIRGSSGTHFGFAGHLDVVPAGDGWSVDPFKAEISDEQLFSDVYSIEESIEPRAAAPIQGLFEPAVSELSEEGEN